jgi:hypothetical protein
MLPLKPIKSFVIYDLAGLVNRYRIYGYVSIFLRRMTYLETNQQPPSQFSPL